MLFGIIVFILGSLAQSDATRPRAVNVALETVMEFKNRDQSDLDFIDKVQNFLSKVKKTLNKSRPGRRYLLEEKLTFTDFLKQVLEILVRCRDEDLEDILAVFNDEIRKYHYKGCKIYELFHENEGLRRSLGEVLDNMKNTEVNKAKAGFKGFIDRLSKSKLTTQTADFHNYVNSLYANKDKFFKKFLNSFNQVLGRSKRTNMDLVRIIREGLRSIIFDHYSNLNVNARRELKVKIQALWKDIASNMNEKESDFTYDNGDKELYIRENVNNKFSDDITKNNNKDSERERNVREGQGLTNNRINEIYKHLVNDTKKIKEMFWDKFSKINIKDNTLGSLKFNIKQNREDAERLNKYKEKHTKNKTNAGYKWGFKFENDGRFINILSIDEPTNNVKNNNDKLKFNTNKKQDKKSISKHKLVNKFKPLNPVNLNKGNYRQNQYNNIPNKLLNSTQYYSPVFKKLYAKDVEIDDDKLSSLTEEKIIENNKKIKSKHEKSKSNKIRNKYKYIKTTKGIVEEYSKEESKSLNGESDIISSDSHQNDNKFIISNHLDEILRTPKSDSKFTMKSKHKYNEASKNKKTGGVTNDLKHIENVINNETYKTKLKDGESVLIIAADENEDINNLFKKKHKHKRMKFKTLTGDKVVKENHKKLKQQYTPIIDTTAMIPVSEEKEFNISPSVFRKGIKPTVKEYTNHEDTASVTSDSTEEIAIQTTKTKFKKPITKAAESNSESVSKGFTIDEETVNKHVKLTKKKHKKHNVNNYIYLKAKKALRHNHKAKNYRMKNIYLKNNKHHHRKGLKKKPIILKMTGINKFFTKIVTTHDYRPHRYNQHKHQSQTVGRNIHYHNMKKDAPRPKLRRQDKNAKINRDQSRYSNYRKSNDDVKLDTATKGTTIKENNLKVASINVTNVNDTFEDISEDRHVKTNEYEYVTLDYWKGTDAVESAKPTKIDTGTKIKPSPSNSIKTTIKIRNKLKSNGTTSLQKRYITIPDNIHQSIIPINGSTKRNDNQVIRNDANTSNNVISTTYMSEVTVIPYIKAEQTIPYTKDILNDKQIDFRASNNTITPSQNITKSPMLPLIKTEMKPPTLMYDAFGSIEREYIKNQTLPNEINITQNNSKISISTKENLIKSITTKKNFQNITSKEINIEANKTRRFVKNMNVATDNKRLEKHIKISEMVTPRLDNTVKSKSFAHQMANIFLNNSNIIEVDDSDKFKNIQSIMAKDMEAIFVPSTTTTVASTTVTDAFDVMEDALDMY